METESRVKNMKIMFLADTYVHDKAGTEKQIKILFDELSSNPEINCQFAVLRETQYISENKDYFNAEILNIGKIFSASALIKAIRFCIKIKKRKIDLVHIFFNDSSIIFPILLKLTGNRIIISRRDMGFWYNKLNTFILRINRHFIDGVIVNCNAVKLKTQEVEKISKDRIHVIYNGQEFYKTNTTGTRERTNKIIGIVANIRPIKRIEDLILAFSKVVLTTSNVKLMIIGEGDTEYLKKIAIEKNVDDKIIFYGGTDNPESLIYKFDVGILCSESEGLSNTIIEYMKNMVPVVCTDTGGNPELIENKKNGFLVKVGDVDELAKRIIQILNNRELSIRFAQNSFEKVSNMCDKKKMTENILEVYKQILI